MIRFTNLKLCTDSGGGFPMDDGLFWIITNRWFFIIIILIVIIVYSFYRFKNVKRVLETQAMKRNGTVKRIGFHSGNTLTFNSGNHHYTVSEYAGSRYQMPYSRVVTKLNKKIENTLKIYGESWASGIGKKFGKQDIQLGSSTFDDQFMIQASDEMFAINLITYSTKLMKIIIRYRYFIYIP